MPALVTTLVLATILGLMLRMQLRADATPRCGDCRQVMPATSGTCPACGGHRGN